MWAFYLPLFLQPWKFYITAWYPVVLVNFTPLRGDVALSRLAFVAGSAAEGLGKKKNVQKTWWKKHKRRQVIGFG